MEKRSTISPYCYPGIKKDILPANFNKKQLRITPDEILEIVSKQSGVSIDDILSNSRKTEKVISRHIYCGILRNKYRYSLPFIAEKMKRDHTSIMHAAKQFENRYRFEESFKQLVDKINFHIELNS